MKLSDFDFELPDALIATRPAKPRSSARLLVAQGRRISDRSVTDLSDVLQAGDRLVINNTKVIAARLFGIRRRNSAQGPVQARIEVTLLEPRSDGTWLALIKPLKKIAENELIEFNDTLSARLLSKQDGEAILEFNLAGSDFDGALDLAGAMPLPPYIAAKRAADAQDKYDYQTIFAKNSGAVAAPTASLHFDQNLMEALTLKGVEITYVTLHVGAGTFLPVKVDDISQHKMHFERGEVTADAARDISQTRKQGGRVIPVGTTALRLIETAAQNGEILPWQGRTDIFIRPGYRFNVADALMTNFHLPKSTLMMLVSALMGQEQIKQIYRHAIAQHYRFFSYGDASILFPEGQSRH